MLLLILSLTTFALAQEKNDSVTYKARTEIDFEGVDVTGELVKPQGSLILDRQKARFNPLVKLRTDFNPEMTASVSQVK